MNLTITGYSTALFSTWYFIEELGILLDCGDGVTASLLQKSRKIDHVFISHADRDHLTGLMQFNQLNAREGAPAVYYPAHCGSFPAMQEFTAKFDPHVKGTIWSPVTHGDKIWIKKDCYVEAIHNNHVPCDEGMQKSLGYKIVQVKWKLKKEYLALSGNEIKATIESLGKEATHDEVKTVVLSYSGDTPCENFGQWDGSDVLIHEATFLGGEEDKNIQTHGNRHSSLHDVISAAAGISVGQIILGHFSSRYSDEQIETAIIEACKSFRIKINVHRVLPGQVTKNILAGNPVYQAT